MFHPRRDRDLDDRRTSRREIRRCESVLRRTADAWDEPDRRQRGLALWTIGHHLGALGRHAEAVARLDQAWEALRVIEDLLGLAVLARVEQATAMLRCRRVEDAVGLLEEVVDLNLVVPDLPELVPDARAMLMLSLESLGRHEEAVAHAHTVIDAHEDGATIKDRKQVTWALAVQGRTAEQRGDTDQARELFDTVLERCASDPEANAEHVVADARSRRARLLEAIGLDGAALTAYDDVLSAHGRSPDPTVRRAVAMAVAGRARLAPAGQILV